jgi:hypothetical protein
MGSRFLIIERDSRPPTSFPPYFPSDLYKGKESGGKEGLGMEKGIDGHSLFKKTFF